MGQRTGITRQMVGAIKTMVQAGKPSSAIAEAMNVKKDVMDKYVKHLVGAGTVPQNRTFDGPRSGEGADNPMEIPPLPGTLT